MSMQLCELKTSQIRTSGDNPRIINPKSSEFAELVESIRSLGVKVPIHVREKGKNYELLAGERRLLAAKAAGLDAIPALNHGELTDEAAFEVTFAENFARQDLTVLEQGKAIWLLLIKYKGDVPAVASKMGKPEQWVRLLEAINSNLSEKWKKMVLEDTDYQYFTASHLGLIARFPQHIQDKEILKSLQYCGHQTVKELNERLAENFRFLKKAPFSTTGCAGCQNRSSAMPTLWAENPEESSGDNDKCLDAKCWRDKDIRVAKEKFFKIQEKYPNLLCVETENCYEREKVDRLRKIYGRCFNNYQFEKAKESSKEAVPALVVYGKGKGTIIYVKVKKQGETSTSQTGEKRTFKQMRAELEERRWNVTLNEVHSRIVKTELEKINHSDKFFALIALSIGMGIDVSTTGDSIDFIKNAFGLYDKDKKKAIAFITKRIWAIIRDAFQNYYVSGSEGEVELVRMIVPLFDIDLDRVYKEVCERDEFKEPAEWANLKADGTPNVAKAKKAKK